jgi:hypothetical protein
MATQHLNRIGHDDRSAWRYDELNWRHHQAQ